MVMVNPYTDYDLEIKINKYMIELKVDKLPYTKKVVKLRGNWFTVLGFWQGNVYLKSK
jgi:hypothetical protein